MQKQQTDWLLVAILFTAGLFAATQFGKISLTLDQMATLFGRSVAGVSFLVSMVGIIGILFGIVAGQIVAALGGRRVMIGALTAGAVLSCVEALLPNLAIFTLLRLGEGFSHLAIVVAGPPMMAAAANDRDRPVVMAIWATFFSLAFAISAVIFPRILAAGGLPLLFLLHGAGLAILAALVAWRAAPSARSPQNFAYIAATRAAYASARLSAPGLGFVFYTFTFVALLTFLPQAIGRPGWVVLFPLVNLAGTMIAGRILQSYPADRVAIWGFAGTALFSLLMLGTDWAAFPMFLFLGVVPGASFAYISTLNPGDEDRARSTGVIAQLGNVGTAGGTPVFALAMLYLGGQSLIWLTAIVSLIGIAVVWAMHRRVLSQSS